MPKQGKKYREKAKLVDKGRFYEPQEAIELAKKTSFANFDGTVEVHFQLGVNPRHSDQQVRGTAFLPGGLGKKVRVLVFTQGEGEKVAKEAGADYVGADDLIKEIEGGWLEFDRALATPDMMPKIGKLGKILGRRGLMPNPKAGTLVKEEDLPQVIKNICQGQVEFKLDRNGLVHLPIGKLSFSVDRVLQNLSSVTEAIMEARPGGVKGQYIKGASLATSMGPGIKLDVKALMDLRGAS